MGNRKKCALLLSSIAISNLGEWVYFIALNLIVLELTHSPMAVSILYILSPIANIVVSFWAGSWIDRLNQKRVMIFLDIFRGGCVLLLAFSTSLVVIYVFSFFIYMANAIFRPTSLVYMTKLVPETNRQRFNALKNFVQSCGFLMGPSIAGILFMIGTPELAIRINAIALFFSAFILFFLPHLERQNEAVEKITWQVIKKDWHRIYHFAKSAKFLTIIYALFSGVTLLMSAIDSLEAAFATIVLGLSNSQYGFLVSIAGLGIVIGAILNTIFSENLRLGQLMSVGAIFTAVGYIIYATSFHFVGAAIGFFLLTFAFSFANTGFLTFIQEEIPNEIMGRFISLFSIFESIGIILFTLILGLGAQLISIQLTVLMGSFILLGISFVILYCIIVKSKISNN
ncbi:MFS transporter [Viridibacillus sp. YIM B01967]|uniref:MFS transporter n=1 Tax=Viridibacillus soli TaxID=2798301 RepID=A0ABS1HAE7_9BACL|nr:MFS transporter [Viridibacillus soli]MBK3496376.1 MFS transporter [Viridibacillus soli]